MAHLHVQHRPVRDRAHPIRVQCSLALRLLPALATLRAAFCMRWRFASSACQTEKTEEYTASRFCNKAASCTRLYFGGRSKRAAPSSVPRPVAQDERSLACVSSLARPWSESAFLTAACIAAARCAASTSAWLAAAAFASPAACFIVEPASASAASAAGSSSERQRQQRSCHQNCDVENRAPAPHPLRQAWLFNSC